MLIKIDDGQYINTDFIQFMTRDPEDPSYYKIRFINDKPDKYGCYSPTLIKKEVARFIWKKCGAADL